MTSARPVAVVGAGFSGAVIAHVLASNGYRVEVFEARDHVAGNCHTARDPETGVMVHTYGPHIFHTDNEDVWKFVNSFGELMPFVNRVKAQVDGRVYSLPINLMTINQVFGKALSPAQAREFVAELGDDSITDIQSFEDQALRFLGRKLYDMFFHGYTLKQWGMSPTELPASILKRLPVRFDYNDNYYASRFQGMPRDGYTAIVEKILAHDAVTVSLSTPFARADVGKYEHVFYTGPIDAWFDHSAGRLGYRTLDFEVERHEGDYQGNAVINYGDQSVPWTRISEHKHFAPWESHEKTLIFKEFSRACEAEDTPYYPIRMVKDKGLLEQYVQLARQEAGVTFLGRLGTYRYLDMHVAIAEALNTAQTYLQARGEGAAMPVFVNDPLA